MLKLEKAEIGDVNKIFYFYENVIDSLKNTEFKPKWNINNYPNSDFINEKIKKEELYIAKLNNEILAAVILNHDIDERYLDANWKFKGNHDEILVIHTFAVHPKFSGKGYGRAIFQKIKNYAIKNNYKSIRLDVINGNIGAQKVFEHFGFKFIQTKEIIHKDVGLEKFHLYEYVLDI